MNSHPWCGPWRLAGLVLASALGCSAALAQPISSSSALAAEVPSLAQAVEAAWQRSLELSQTQGLKRQAQAQRQLAESWLAAAPALALSQREGTRNSSPGSRETEIGVALPLWWPGQRAASAQAAQAELDWAAAAGRAARLQLAGQVREAAGSLHELEAQARQAALQTEALQQLAEDVQRRVKGGDLAPADALAAQAEWLSARADEAQARQRLQAQRSAWSLLTGLAQTPAAHSPAAASALDAGVDTHPELELAVQALALARQRASLLQSQPQGATPELGLGLRQERAGGGAAAQHSLTLGLRLPFGATTQAQPRLAAALAEQDLALVAEQRTRARLAAELEQARAGLDSSQSQARLASERAALLRERATLIGKSFRAGESPLPELLRALGAAAQAESASVAQQAALSLAQARLQQALGITP